MSFERIETPKVRLYNLTLGFLKSFDMSVDQTAGSLVAAISDDPAALVELVGKDRLFSIAQEYAQRLYDEDIRGGGIGLRPADKTGSDAVADETGHDEIDTHRVTAHSSAPQSETPAAKPVGGGQAINDAQCRVASPTSPASAKRVTISESPPPPKKLETGKTIWSLDDVHGTRRALPETPKQIPGVKKAPYVAPKERTSAESQLKVKNLIAASVLGTTMIRGKPLGKYRKGEGLALGEKLKWEGYIVNGFCQSLPDEETVVEEFYTVYEAEQMMKTLEANYAP